MPDLRRLLESLGGTADTRTLLRAGATEHDLTTAVRAAVVQRPRRGWYTLRPPADPRFEAIRIGGRVTGTSALRLLGAWMWRDPPLHVSLPPNAARLRSRSPGVELHYDSREVLARGGPETVDLADAFPRAVRTLCFEEAVAILDWGHRAGILDRVGIAEIAARLPRSLARIEEWVDPLCESFLESVVRTRLRQAGHVVTSQVPVSVTRAIDIVVDDLVAVEIDGRQFHAETFVADRTKDLDITRDGRHALRIGYHHVAEEWSRAEEAIEAALALHRGAAKRHTRVRMARAKQGHGSKAWALEPPRRQRGMPETGARLPVP